jgi:hypothetical protein
MSTLIIHPQDSTTNFLKPIYALIQDETVITGGITKSELKKLIENHDRVIMLGHGSPFGLLSVGQFPKAGNYIVDYSMVDLLVIVKTSSDSEAIFASTEAKRFPRHLLPE